MNNSMVIEQGKSGTKYRWFVLILCFILYLFDNYVMFILGLTMAPVRESLGIDAVAGGLISSSTMLGAVIGCVLIGRVSNTWGSRNTLVLMGIILGISSFGCTLTNNYELWMVLRFITGVGVGSMLGPCVKLIADHWGPKHRSMATAATLASFSIAGLVAAFITKIFIADNWTFIYSFAAIAIIPALLLLFTPSDKLTKDEIKAAAASNSMGFSSILQGNLKFITFFAIMVSFFNMAGAWSLGTWLPSWLIQERGLSTDLMTNFSMVNYIGGFIGYFFWSKIGSKLGSARALIVGYVATAAAMVLYLIMPGDTILFWMGPVVYFCQAMNVLMSITFQGAYPRVVRAYGAGTDFNVGRIGSIISPYTTAAIGTSFGLTAGLATVPVFYGVGVLFAVGLKRYVDRQQASEADSNTDISGVQIGDVEQKRDASSVDRN